MDLDKIATHNEQQAQNAEERAKIEDTALALNEILKSQKGIEDSVRTSILALVKFIRSHKPEVSVNNQKDFPKYDEVVSAVKEVVAEVKNSNKALKTVEQKEVDFSGVVKSLEGLSKLVAKLPTTIPVAKSVEVSNQKDYTGKFDEVTKAVGKIPAPIVNVEKTVIPDNSKELEKLLKAVEKIKFPDIPKTDLKPLLEATNKVSKTIANLSFPVPNYVLPFKDVEGRAVQVQLDSNGNIPTSSSGGSGLTDAELRATPVPVSGTLTVDDTDNTASGTISTQNLVPAGTATANSSVEITLGSGQNSIAVQTVGTYTGALTLQGTVDGTNWVSFAGTPLLNANTGLWLATITSALQSVFFAKVSGFNKVRISANAAVTGSVTVSIGASAGDSFQGALGVLTTLTSITNWGNIVDNAAFTDGTTRLSPNGYIFDEVAGTALTENDAAAARVDSKRAQVFTIEDETTRGRRTTVTASNALKVDGRAVTQPTTTTVASNNYGTVVSLASGATGTLVTIASSPAGYKIRGFTGTGNGDGYFFITVAGSTVLSGRIHNMERQSIITLPNPISVATASAVLLKVTNEAAGASDYEATLLGE